eukprot:jgi/Tetstr1/421121/TSEL_012164.t1
MDPQWDFRLPGASEAKHFGISVATLRTLYKREWRMAPAGARHPPEANMAAQPGPTPATRTTTAPGSWISPRMRTRTWGGSGSEWEYEGSDEDDDLELSPTTGRVLTSPERLIKHGTVERGAANCLPCLAEAEVFNITDVDGGQPTGLVYKIPAGTLCRPCKQDAGSHPRSPTPRQPDGRKPRRADRPVGK